MDFPSFLLLLSSYNIHKYMHACTFHYFNASIYYDVLTPSQSSQPAAIQMIMALYTYKIHNNILLYGIFILYAELKIYLVCLLYTHQEKEEKDDEDVMRGYDNRHLLLCLFYST